MKRLWLLLVAAVFCMALTGCHSGSTFDGNILRNEDCFQMEYTVLDQQESASIALGEGDTLCVSVSQERGVVDIVVGIDGKEPIYEGNGLTDMDFSLNISQFGDYQISVTGHEACGSVAFIKAAAENVEA